MQEVAWRAHPPADVPPPPALPDLKNRRAELDDNG